MLYIIMVLHFRRNHPKWAVPEGIETITFQTILCSTTLSLDELLAMGGEDAEAVLTHRLTASSLTVG